ncbi:MAG: hypothetical protein PHW25_14665 [Zoogloea sp.]|uniref:hypothetical protein n=1 Tax=Zoogloea sp. TaxID=49181 RepID=UPI002615009B|nr:hypothetical protein [Zoogloea sp.]MDD3328322.1 hypothetical protein [Zoogloea sp.]
MDDVQIIFAGRKAHIFNERFRRGDAVMHRLTPGGIAQFDRVYGAAFVQNGESVVELAGRAGVVPTDRLFSPPPRPTGWAHSRAQLAALLLAFTLGAAVVVLLAVSTDPSHRAQAAGLDCDAPAVEAPTNHRSEVTA